MAHANELTCFKNILTVLSVDDANCPYKLKTSLKHLRILIFTITAPSKLPKVEMRRRSTRDFFFLLLQC